MYGAPLPGVASWRVIGSPDCQPTSRTTAQTMAARRSATAVGAPNPRKPSGQTRGVHPMADL
jgi:hypothetical protein